MNRSLLFLLTPLCLVFIAAGLYLATRAARSILKGRALETWPTVSGEVIRTEFVTHHDGDSDIHEVKVEYRYQVAGKVYLGTRIHPAYSPTNLAGQRRLFEQLREAGRVAVYYNELAPEEAYVVKGIYAADLIPVVMGLLFFLAGAAFLAIGCLAAGGLRDYGDGLQVLQQRPAQQTVAEDAGPP